MSQQFASILTYFPCLLSPKPPSRPPCVNWPWSKSVSISHFLFRKLAVCGLSSETHYLHHFLKDRNCAYQCIYIRCTISELWSSPTEFLSLDGLHQWPLSIDQGMWWTLRGWNGNNPQSDSNLKKKKKLSESPQENRVNSGCLFGRNRRNLIKIMSLHPADIAKFMLIQSFN